MEGARAGCLDDDGVLAFLDGALPSERRAQVEEHLGTCADCRRLVSFLARYRQSQQLSLQQAPTVEGGPELSASSTRPDRPWMLLSDQAPPLPRGTLVGRYVVLELVGKGGMGVVYAAYDPALDRRIALKILRDDTAVPADERESRLRREAQAMARLSHANTVPVFDVGAFGERVFVAMELVHGLTLTRWLAEQPRTWREILQVFRGAGRGLAAAHAAGLVHRDFKPDNVLVDASDHPRVTDFGLARVEPSVEVPLPEASLSSESLSTASITRTGVIAGTPAYMAPEQHRGQPTDARSDQFSFCVALYQALYGVRPFAGETTRELLVAEVEGRIHEPPSSHAVPTWVRRVLLRGLSADPEDRYPSMEALLAALDNDPVRRWKRVGLYAGVVAAALLGTLVSQGLRGAPPAPVCKDAARRWDGVWDAGRKRALQEAFLAAGGPTAEPAWQRVQSVLDAYSQAWTAMRTEACEATRVRGEQSDEVLSLRMSCLDRRLDELSALTELLSHPDPALVKQSIKAAHALTRLDTCANVDALRAPLKPPQDGATREQVTQLRLQLARGKALMDSARYKDALELAKTTASAADALGYRPLQAEALDLLGTLLERTGEEAESEQTFERALWAAEAGGHQELAALVSARLVRSNLLQAKYKEGRVWASHGFGILEHMGGQPRVESFLEMALGSICLQENQLDKGLEHFKRALPLREQVFGPNHPDVAAVYNNIGAAYGKADRHTESRAAFERALAIWEKALGEEHPEVENAVFNLAVSAELLGKDDEALAYYDRARKILEKTLGTEHPSYADVLSREGSLHVSRGAYDLALPMLEHAGRVLEKVRGSSHPAFAANLNRLGMVYMGKGDLPKALGLFRRALQVADAAKSNPVETAFASINVALVQQDLGRSGEALPLLRRARALLEEKVGKDHSDYAYALDGLAGWNLGRRQYRQALELSEQSAAILEKTLGANNPRLMSPLIVSGEAKLGMKSAKGALPPLERAVQLGESQPVEPQLRAEARFALAQALWEAGADRSRALALAAQGKQDFAKAGRKREVAQVERWLAKHGRSRGRR